MFGLHILDIIAIIAYLLGITALGMWSKRTVHNREDFFVGGRRFGSAMMAMHAFGTGTNTGQITTVVSESYTSGIAGIWVQWQWMFATPFYWILAPLFRRMRCITVADCYEERYGSSASLLYVIVAPIGMIVHMGLMLLGTGRVVQGMLGIPADQDVITLGSIVIPNASLYISVLVMTVLFVSYSAAGGIVAAVRTDFVQGLFIIILSILALPSAFSLVNGMNGLREKAPDAARQAVAQSISALPEDSKKLLTMLYIDGQGKEDAAKSFGISLDELEKRLASAKKKLDNKNLQDPKGIMRLTNPAGGEFTLFFIAMLSINALFSIVAQPHIISVTSAGKTEFEGRVGMTYGNFLKRLCTIGWTLLGVCWLVYHPTSDHPDKVFGEAIQGLLGPLKLGLVGLMLASVMAAAMSSCDSIMVSVSGIYTQNLYRRYIRKDADEAHYVKVARIISVGVVVAGVVLAVTSKSLMGTLLVYLKITATIGIAFWLGILWRRANTAGVWASFFMATICWGLTKYYWKLDNATQIALYLSIGITAGVIASLLTAPPPRDAVDRFFAKFCTPIGQEEKLNLSFNEVLPQKKRLVSAAGILIPKPSRETWLGFLIAWVIVALIILGTWWLINL